MFHHTLTVDQAKDIGWADVGFHYVALNASAQPADSDNDGWPDYLEDKNGNGIFDSGSGETDWQTSNSQTPDASSLLIFTVLK